MVCAAEDFEARKEGLHPRASPKKQEAQKFQGRYVKLPVPVKHAVAKFQLGQGPDDSLYEKMWYVIVCLICSISNNTLFTHENRRINMVIIAGIYNPNICSALQPEVKKNLLEEFLLQICSSL